MRVSRGRPFNGGDVACAVDDAHDLNALLGNAIEGEPSLDDYRPRFWLDLWPRAAQQRIVFEQPACAFDAVIDAIGDRFRIALGDEARCRAGPPALGL